MSHERAARRVAIGWRNITFDSPDLITSYPDFPSYTCNNGCTLDGVYYWGLWGSQPLVAIYLQVPDEGFGAYFPTSDFANVGTYSDFSGMGLPSRSRIHLCLSRLPSPCSSRVSA